MGNTTIQISNSLRRKLKILASQRDASYEEILNDLISVFEKSNPFRDEADFSKWFEKNFQKFGFKKIIKKRKKTSPDYELLDAAGKIKNVELELFAKDFIKHKHDSAKTDLIISVYAESEEINNVPVISIIDSKKPLNNIIKKRDHNFTSITLPVPLMNKIKRRMKNTGFTSVSSYVTFILRILEYEGKSTGKPFTKESRERVKKRLKALGYI
ncbi:MAG: hypothetical protein ACE5NL_01695 [Candidatus Hydrothermarchaeaceae archaeon]